MTQKEFEAILKEGKLITCECGYQFRWKPSHNNPIPPKKCRICYNTEMLMKSNLATKKWKSKHKPDKSLIKGKNGREIKNTASKDKFYKTSAWRWFSRYILLTNTIDKDSITARCCTCGKLMRIDSRECHLGHYIKVKDANSTNYSTAFVETNVAPQCLRCNKYMGGRQDEMAQYLKKKYGPNIIDELHVLKKLPLKLDDSYLAEIAESYKKKFYSYLKEYNLQNPWKK